MSLDIYTTDDKKNFHIGYISFSNMRGLFILSIDEESYKIYDNILRNIFNPSFETEDWYIKIYGKIGDLKILIDHSDCDGELSVEECKKLKPCLSVDEQKIYSITTEENKEYYQRLIKQMYEFIELIDYSIQNNVKLIFG